MFRTLEIRWVLFFVEVLFSMVQIRGRYASFSGYLLDVNSDRTEHVNHAKPESRSWLESRTVRLDVGILEHTQVQAMLEGRGEGGSRNFGLAIVSAICRSYVESGSVLRANAPVKPRARSSRVKPRKNWLFFPTVGTNGLPDAVCQTSCNDESMCHGARLSQGDRSKGVGSKSNWSFFEELGVDWAG